tara:strand:- start:1188 stop:1523 length:336 start_codon:yes stop_codon:yes gene_type:complete
MELLICEDFHFYNNGVYKTISKLSPEGWFQDIKKVEPSIRIFGTRNQIDEALDVYIKLTELNLDECFDFKVEPKGSYFYDEERNKIIENKLAEYKERYNKLSNNKALITTI